MNECVYKINYKFQHNSPRNKIQVKNLVKITRTTKHIKSFQINENDKFHSETFRTFSDSTCVLLASYI